MITTHTNLEVASRQSLGWAISLNGLLVEMLEDKTTCSQGVISAAASLCLGCLSYRYVCILSAVTGQQTAWCFLLPMSWCLGWRLGRYVSLSDLNFSSAGTIMTNLDTTLLNSTKAASALHTVITAAYKLLTMNAHVDW